MRSAAAVWILLLALPALIPDPGRTEYHVGSAGTVAVADSVYTTAGERPFVEATYHRSQKRMSSTARGSFSVEMKPQADTGAEDGNTSLGRMSLDKCYEGDLVATATGEMLTAMTATEGSAGYVAIERVSGALEGRDGSFVLQHSGTMGHGDQSLTITVVPDSGTGELTGIEGRLKIEIVDGEHFYEFAYSLPS